MPGKRILLLLGGMFHDFAGYEAHARLLLQNAGHTVTATYEYDVLQNLDRAGVDLVLSYTSLSRHREGHPTTTPESFTAEQTAGLVAWVRGGGALLGVHSASVMGKDNPPMQALLGGRFINHPPQFVFTVYPTSHDHPITHDVEAFSVKDELYIQEYDPSVEIHMVTMDRGVAYPMVWTRTEGQGRVAHITMGHSDAVWSLPQFQRLELQAVDWLTAR